MGATDGKGTERRRAGTRLLGPVRAVVMGGLVLAGVGGARPADAGETVVHRYGADTVVAAAATPDGAGLWTLTAGGAVHGTDGARGFGAIRYGLDPVAIAGSAGGGGYWIATASGTVFPFGNAADYGDVAGLGLRAAIVGMASTPDHGGYWLLGADGGVFSFGNAAFYGSTGALRLNQPIVGMVATASGAGYWLVARDGGIFSFGDARFHGSTGGLRLNASVIGMSVTASGRGYRLVASDGGVFSFGDAAFYGSLGATPGVPAAALATTPNGYWVASADGEVYKIAAGWNAPLAPPSRGPHNYLARIGDSPLRWDPCHAIRVEWNFAGRGYEAVLAQALAKVAAATGFTFVPVGSTSATIGPDAAADILVVVRRASEYPFNGAWGDTNIVGRWSLDRTEQYLTAATISVNADHSADAGWGGLNPIGPLLLHELGHAVGLDHVFDLGEVMNQSHIRTEFGPGDLEGLWRVGAAAGCAH